jgi:hypothetical protein
MAADVVSGPRSPRSKDRRPAEFENFTPREQELLSHTAEGRIEAQELRYRAEETRRDAIRLSDFSRTAREANRAHYTIPSAA